ncbi:RMD1 family protein [Holosporaceae bacterium 'Namur']|nr:RMD1 family protein [Holosporaceae bacterium 'Namur']
MRCAYYCCGESYDLHKISEFFTNQGYITKLHEPEVLYVKLVFPDNMTHDIFIFSYGCITLWGLDFSRERQVITSISPFLTEPSSSLIVDSCKYQVSDEETFIDEESDLISLETDDPYIKLSLSYGLSQASKLVQFENSLDRTIDSTKHIPNEIIKTGKISLSRKTLSIKIGQLFAERNSINLHSTILDTPEFFWRRPKYQPYYDMAVEFMDIHTRIEILNKRLNVVHELYEILSNELKYIHTSRLELIIIYLILIEVLIAVFRDLLGWLN